MLSPHRCRISPTQMSSINPLADKTIIFINSGGRLNRFTIESAKRFGCKVILVNNEFDVPGKLVDHFVQADTYDGADVIERLSEFFDKNPEVLVDGALTFYEDDIPLLARVCEHFGFVGNSSIAAIATRNKYEMRKRFKETGLGSPEFQLVKNRSDLRQAISQIGFPAVMKPAWGVDSWFVVLVNDEDEALDTFEYLQRNCNEQFDPIFKYNEDMFLYEEFVDGSEISLECFAQFGIPHVIGVHEKLPIKPPYFVEYGDVAPARIPEEMSLEVIKLAESALIALGVQNSLAHIEMKMSSKGPKLIEVASRMGGDDIFLNVKTVWGVDLVRMALQIAVGERVDYRRKEPRACAVCRYFIPSASGIITNISGLREAQKMSNVLDLALNKDVGDAVLVPPEGFENLGWVTTTGRSYQDAETTMARVMRKLEINVTPFHKKSALGKTVRKDALSSASLVRGEIMRAAKLEKIRSLDAVRGLRLGIVSNSIARRNGSRGRKTRYGEEVRDILKERGHNVALFDMDEMSQLLKKLQRSDLDFILNLCEDAGQLEGQAAALFELLQIPFTGSNSATLALCQDKVVVKKLFDYHDIPTPNWDCVYNLGEQVSEDLTFPLIVKPANTDNCFGITNDSVVTTKAELRRQVEYILTELKRPALIEEYIEGDEFDICLWGNKDEVQVLPLVRSVFDKLPESLWDIYHAQSRGPDKKKAYEAIRLEKPARIPKKLATLISEIALDVYNLFDCLDYAKVEIRTDRHGNPYVLEVNPNPPVGPEDTMAICAGLDGYSYEEFVEELILVAVQRYRESAPIFEALAGE